MSINDKPKFAYLIEFLQSERDSLGPWIQRKEISVWSAVVLYLSGIFVVANIFFSRIDYKTLTSTIYLAFTLFIMMCLFIYFVFIQFSSITNSMATQRAIYFWMFALINKQNIPDEFSFNYDKNTIIPISINAILKMARGGYWFKGFKKAKEKQNEYNKQYTSKYAKYIPKNTPILKPVRQTNILFRFLLPYIHFISKVFCLNRSFAHIELEEAIIYNLLVWPTIFIFLYYILFFDC